MGVKRGEGATQAALQTGSTTGRPCARLPVNSTVAPPVVQVSPTRTAVATLRPPSLDGCRPDWGLATVLRSFRRERPLSTITAPICLSMLAKSPALTQHSSIGRVPGTRSLDPCPGACSFPELSLHHHQNSIRDTEMTHGGLKGAKTNLHVAWDTPRCARNC